MKIKKVLLILKLLLCFILVSMLNVSGSIFSQSATFDLAVNGKTVKEVFKDIEQQSKYRFLHNDDFAGLSRIVSINSSDKDIDEVLGELLAGAHLTYRELENDLIVITPLELTGAQEEVRGRVIDSETGEPLPGVAILIQGTSLGTVTGPDGYFSIAVPGPEAVLQFSYVGYMQQMVEVGDQSEISVILQPELTALDEVIVVGYGTQRLATATGSISQARGEELQRAPVLNFSNVFAGRLPGLVAVSRSGEPGSDGATLRIRGANTLGNNSPLVVVDGIIGRDLQRLNPEDIESVTVLKDASAAIYGAQAANGVILITTKRGEVSPLQVSVTHNQGWGMPTVIPEMADAATYATLLNEIDYYEGRTPRFEQNEIQMFVDGSDPWRYPNTDWFDEVYKTAAPQRVTNATVRGGSEALQYFVSLGYNFQDAIYKNSATNYNQASFRSNFDANLSEHVRLSLDLSGRQTTRNYPTRSASNIHAFIMRGKPNLHAYWPNGLNGPDIEYGDNPVVTTTDQTGRLTNIHYVFENVIKLDADIPWVKGLKATGNLSIDKTMLNRKQWQTPWYLYTWDGTSYDENNEPALIQGQRGFVSPQLRQDFNDTERITMNALLNYNTSIQAAHNINLLVGTERITGESMSFWAFRRYFDSDAIDQLFAGGDAEKDNSGSASQHARLNYFGRFNYDYLGKYMLEFVFRYDGSFIFPAEGRYGFFPGVSVGYRISEEDFWQNSLSFIDYFKLRSSWGQTGNDRVEPYQYMTSFGFRSQTYIFGSTAENKNLRELRTPNPNVTWEIANQFNIGFDGMLMGDRITFSGDYFYNLRTNILWWRDASVPATSGISLPRENIGEVSNQGVEFSLGYRNHSREFRYDINISGGTNKNRIEFWDETPGVPDYQKSTGHPMNSQLVYNAIGIFQSWEEIENYPSWAGARPGDIIFEDVNGDGVIDGRDRMREYRTDLPTFTGGLNINMSWRNFYGSVFFQAATGAVRNNYYQMQGEVGNFLARDAENRWTEDNPSTTNPRTWNRYEQYWRNHMNSYWLQSSDYLRLKNLEIGYNIPVEISGIRRLSIYFSGQNLLTFTAVKDFDPETTSNTAYPLNKVFNIGATLNF